MNRDENRSRLEGQPKIMGSSEPVFWHPVDSVSKGTWCGINRHGLVACLLNRYQDKVESSTLSRGQLVPSVVKLNDLAAVIEHFKNFDWTPFQPCDLVVLKNKMLLIYEWTGKNISLKKSTLLNPIMLTSSSVDIAKATQWRQQCLKTFTLDSSKSNASSILNLHVTQCNQNPSLGILMDRGQRHTKSITQMSTSEHAVKARYLTSNHAQKNIAQETWDITWPISRD